MGSNATAPLSLAASVFGQSAKLLAELELRVDIAKAELQRPARVRDSGGRSSGQSVRISISARVSETAIRSPVPLPLRQIDKNVARTLTFVKVATDQNVNFSHSSCQHSARRLNCAPCAGKTGSGGSSFSVKLPWMAYFQLCPVYGEPGAPNECDQNRCSDRLTRKPFPVGFDDPMYMTENIAMGAKYFEGNYWKGSSGSFLRRRGHQPSTDCCDV